ncbi:hypothetical protein D3C73_1133810 [compost metagenome]
MSPKAFALWAGATILTAMVKESTTTSAVLIAVNTLAIIIKVKFGLKYVIIFPIRNTSKEARYNFLRSILLVNTNKTGPAIA